MNETQEPCQVCRLYVGWWHCERHCTASTYYRRMAGWGTCVNIGCTFQQFARQLVGKQSQRKLPWKYLQYCNVTTVSASEAVGRPVTKWTISSNLKRNGKTIETVLPQSAMSVNTELQKEEEILEYFIPVTKSALVRYLLEEPNFLNTNEKNKFEQLAAALDHITRNRFEGVYDEIKNLFDPLNPNKSLLSSRSLILRDRLDQEFWLVQKLATVLEKANFYEIPNHVIEAISLPHTNQGIKLSIDTSRYSVLRLWALGQEVTYPPIPWYEESFRQLAGRWYPQFRLPPRRPRRYLRRVVAAIRLKTDSTLQIKAFRDVPINRIPLILPDGQIEPTKGDSVILLASAWATLMGALAQTVCYVASVDVVWPLVTAFLSSLVLSQRWTNYHAKRNAFLTDANRTQFFKNVASNLSLVESLVDRALAENLKEVLLVYAFLLTQRPPSTHDKRSHHHAPNELGGITRNLLEKNIEHWVRRTFGVRVQFDAYDAISVLESLGLLSEQEECDQQHVLLHVQPLDVAIKMFPAPPRRLLDVSEESDIIEGYDKDVVYDDIVREDNIIRKHGWN